MKVCKLIKYFIPYTEEGIKYAHIIENEFADDAIEINTTDATIFIEIAKDIDVWEDNENER